MKALLSNYTSEAHVQKNVIYKLYCSACRTPVSGAFLGSGEIKTTVAQPSRSLEVLMKGLLIDMLLHMQWVSDGHLGV